MAVAGGPKIDLNVSTPIDMDQAEAVALRVARKLEGLSLQP
jgi:hypothetical protein